MVMQNLVNQADSYQASLTTDIVLFSGEGVRS